MHWDETADVVVVGNGCAGAVAAIAAREEGADVLICEKQPQDTHCSTSAMSGGSIFLPRNEGAMGHLEALNAIPTGLPWTEPEILRTYVHYGLKAMAWLNDRGGQARETAKVGEHKELPGHTALVHYSFSGMGYGLQRFLNETLARKNVAVRYSSPATSLITDSSGRVVGVEAECNEGTGRKTVKIGASRGVVLASGGFEYHEQMKLNYLPVHPSYFIGHPSSTGDGIRMAMAVGADLWHMNCVPGRLVAKFPEFPTAFSIYLDAGGVRGVKGVEKIAPDKRPGFVIVDREGKRFTNEEFKPHSVYYEVTHFDTHRMAYPRVPCYWIMDSRRIEIDTLVAMKSGPAGPFRLYEWSKDNGREIEKGWIITASSIGSLAAKLDLPAASLAQTVAAYNDCCASGVDSEFGRKRESLIPLDRPPYFAVRLWPGGPNTQGGPKRNARCQIVNVHGDPIPGLYGAGEMGSMFGMLYPGSGGDLGECLTMGRVAGEQVAHEPRK